MSDERGRDRQLHLFGAPVPRRSGVGPAPPTPEIAELSSRLPPQLRLGTSSWSFPGWAGLVYDREASAALLARRGLEAYAAHPLFRSVGIDRTFYAPLSAEALAGFARAVPEDFRFLVKAGQTCTMPRLRDPGEAGVVHDNDLFLDPVHASEQFVGPFLEGLGAKGGPLLFQFPPLGAEFTSDPARFARRLGAFLSELPSGPQYAVEIRNRALLGQEYAEALRQSGATHCLTLHPSMPGLDAQLAACPPAGGQRLVVRWMLRRGLSYEGARQRYEPFSEIVDDDRETRHALAELCATQLAAGREVLVIANNKAEGSAPRTLERLAQAVVERI